MNLSRCRDSLRKRTRNDAIDNDLNVAWVRLHHERKNSLLGSVRMSSELVSLSWGVG